MTEQQQQSSEPDIAELEKKKFHLSRMKVKVSDTSSCLTLCVPMDCSPSGSSLHGILQAIILEWVAISFSRGSSQARDLNAALTLQEDSIPTKPPGNTDNINSVDVVRVIISCGKGC